jgi:putative FmdB family regulatory protein
MPIYEYRCSECGFQDEYLQKVSEPPMSVCPTCGKATFKKLLSAAGFQLKGSGWYATDFKTARKPGASAPAKSADSAAESKGDSGAGSSGDSKAESKGESKGEAKPVSKNEAAPA